MEVHRPFTRRNVICAVILGMVALSYWLSIWWMNADMTRAERLGQHGEAASLVVGLLLLPAAYTSLFFVATFSSALQRGSQPMSYWLLSLGLLPTALLVLLFLASIFA